MPTDHPIFEYFVHLTEQASNAIFRILGNRYMPHPGILGTIEIFRAIEDCRTGLGKAMLKKMAPKGWDIHDKRIDQSEYKAFPIVTSKADRVLNKAVRYALDQQEQVAGTDHLLLALIDTPDTAFTSMGEIFSFRVAPVREQLRSHLGLDSGIKPAMRAYDLCVRIERDMKYSIIRRLMKKHGDHWWVAGVPEKIRKKCAERREEEACELEVEAYFDLIDLREIIKSNWDEFKQALRSGKQEPNKEKATAWMAKMNKIRNAVMHPSKREINADDIETLQESYNDAQKFCAKIDE